VASTLTAKQPVPQACSLRPIECGSSSNRLRRPEATRPVATQPDVPHSIEFAAHVKGLDGEGGSGELSAGGGGLRLTSWGLGLGGGMLVTSDGGGGLRSGGSCVGGLGLGGSGLGLGGGSGLGLGGGGGLGLGGGGGPGEGGGGLAGATEQSRPPKPFVQEHE
jgi:hypothetical protein